LCSDFLYGIFFTQCLVFHFYSLVINKNVLCVFFEDDPYYCGMRARIPNFVKRKNGGKQEVVERMPPHAVPMAAPPAMMTASHHYMHSAYGVAPVQPWRANGGYHEPGETSLTNARPKHSMQKLLTANLHF
jgi:hypothetical protein